MSAELIRAIAFYLPQFHPIPENDEWWGMGFTEWTNVAKARPLFRGHYQPHLPTDLGFYDLRLPEARRAQADLAREYGIHGFCYYHYWFNGRRLLERPFAEVLASGQPDFPFCLCWANENWTRRWDGQEKEVLLQQDYNSKNDIEHIRWLAKVFCDPRYIRIGGRPLFLVYRLSLLPEPAATVERWRSEARKLGVGELYLCNVESFPTEKGLVERCGLDAAVEFAPDHQIRPRITPARWETRLDRLMGYLPRGADLLNALGFTPRVFHQNSVFDYERLAADMETKALPSYGFFRCVTPSWDNTARRTNGGASLFQGATPERYGAWLKRIVSQVRSTQPGEQQLVFINGWNEWAEGNHLEPCRRWGRSYLEATREALSIGSETGRTG